MVSLPFLAVPYAALDLAGSHHAPDVLHGDDDQHLSAPRQDIRKGKGRRVKFSAETIGSQDFGDDASSGSGKLPLRRYPGSQHANFTSEDIRSGDYLKGGSKAAPSTLFAIREGSGDTGSTNPDSHSILEEETAGPSTSTEPANLATSTRNNDEAVTSTSLPSVISTNVLTSSSLSQQSAVGDSHDHRQDITILTLYQYGWAQSFRLFWEYVFTYARRLAKSMASVYRWIVQSFLNFFIRWPESLFITLTFLLSILLFVGQGWCVLQSTHALEALVHEKIVGGVNVWGPYGLPALEFLVFIPLFRHGAQSTIIQCFRTAS